MLKSNYFLCNTFFAIKPLRCASLPIKPVGCTCSVRTIMKKPVTKIPSQSTKGTKMKRYDLPAHRLGVLKSWDSKHTGKVYIKKIYKGNTNTASYTNFENCFVLNYKIYMHTVKVFCVYIYHEFHMKVTSKFKIQN